MLDKNKLPKNFNWQDYLVLNPDIKRSGIVSKDQAEKHWLTIGYKENRQFYLDKNSDISDDLQNFDPKIYRWLNEDLYNLTDLQLIQHYISYGRQEKRKYFINDEIPKNFDPRLYKFYNKDLVHMSNQEATKHYLMHGRRESRLYFCGLDYDSIVNDREENTIPMSKGSVILVNHDISKTGAPVFLYDLYDYLIDQNIFKNIYILEPFPNKILSDKPNKIYHYNSLDYLYKILISTNPSLIYSNSLNFYLLNLDKFEYWHSRTILHFHETYECVSMFINNLKSDISHIPTYVVSESIKNDFIKNSPFKTIDVFPPFINANKKEEIKKLYKEDIPGLYSIDKSKPTIGMCGDLSDRKNILLFLKLAKTYNDYNFVWVGGKDLTTVKNTLDPDNNYPITNNFYWIPNTDNPYLYFKSFDYFFLTSKEDPCPIVVLENLLLNNKIIVIKDNIKTQHQTRLLENYIELKSNNENDIVEEFGKLYLDKISNYTQNNSTYIDNFYSEPKLFQMDKNKKDNIHYIVASIYLDQNILNISLLDQYINIINQFIIRHKILYYFIPVIVLSTNYADIYGDSIRKYLQKSIINMKQGFIFFKNNYGYDIGGLLNGIKIIFDNFSHNITKYSYVAYIHNKTNTSWGNILQNIFYINKLDPYDLIASKRFYVQYDGSMDINKEIFDLYPNIFTMDQTKNFSYIQGTTFITRIEYLKYLYDKFIDIFPLFTNIDKQDEFWQNIMTDDKLFQKYYIQYQNDPLNSPIDWTSQSIVKKYNTKNYMQLYDRYGLKGIPDAQFEHALERYIGYLIHENNPKLNLI